MFHCCYLKCILAAESYANVNYDILDTTETQMGYFWLQRMAQWRDVNIRVQFNVVWWLFAVTFNLANFSCFSIVRCCKISSKTVLAALPISASLEVKGREFRSHQLLAWLFSIITDLSMNPMKCSYIPGFLKNGRLAVPLTKLIWSKWIPKQKTPSWYFWTPINLHPLSNALRLDSNHADKSQHALPRLKQPSHSSLISS